MALKVKSKESYHWWLFGIFVLLNVFFSMMIILDVSGVIQIRIYASMVSFTPETIASQIIDSSLMLFASFVFLGMLILPVVHK